MKYQDNIEQVATLQPDYLGFIFHKKSVRYFDILMPALPKSIKKVGVFVNEAIDTVIEKITTHNLQAVQLHGEESPEYCLELKRHYDGRNEEIISSKKIDYFDFEKKSHNDEKLEIIKVFSIKNEFNFDVLKPYEAVCDYFLFDTKGKLPGGNGFTFNWDVLNNYPSTKPFFLSGGIGLEETENLKQFQQSNASKYCYAIDVNSKFEIEAGLKNIELLKEFKDTVITKNEERMTK
ncbi:phosphoribosylanthranilate isomerase [Mariniflexile litorale]|uniref:N-(5'-phosphoribosyl)anthranilate isomerase n=1 Tax=Mariniflexile litorale TaxID=3045158 RepID=A0AAU7EAG0_9FLAO|nr:phosphoribosylanthranilate isomerase [Mariniflexile sp. KMM 9835]MDQ8213056.1 phosphoribosylanthranilate isomerase [Mariniflexile sp. KMM 9835]